MVGWGGEGLRGCGGHGLIVEDASISQYPECYESIAQKFDLGTCGLGLSVKLIGVSSQCQHTTKDWNHVYCTFGR